MLAYRSEPLIFARELNRLATLANERVTNRVRVLVEVELDPTERVNVATRARSARAEDHYRAAVTRRQDEVVRALGRSPHTEPGFINRVNGLSFVSVYADAREIETLRHLPFVVSVTEEGEGQEFLSETFPQINADFVHPGNTGTYRTVAVIDSGVQTSHPFFGARLVAGACYSSSDYPNNPICAGGAPSGSTTIASGGPCTHVVAGEPAAAGCGHGTHVAGVALGSNATLKGTAPSATLISIQASSLTSNCGGGTSPCRRNLESDVINALIRVYDLRNTHPVASVNLSLGITSKGLIDQECHVLYPAMHAAIQQLDAANIPVVAATGNFASPGSQFNDKVAMPACIGDVISVSAVRKDDTYAAEYASANEFIVDLLAPGGSSAAPGPVESSVVGSGYASTVGTSQAAPHVAGAIALMRNVYPYASPRALERQFNESGPLVTLSYGVAGGGSRNYQERRLDVDDAMIGPASPSGGMGAVTVTRHNCYGSNEVSWSVVSGADEYHVEGSASSSFSSPKLFGLTRLSETNATIDVPGTRYIRVRACNGVTCGAWQDASPTATYYNGCL